MSRMACLAKYVIRSILAHDRRDGRGQMRAAANWQLPQLGGVGGRIVDLAYFGHEAGAIARRARAVGLRVMTVFSRSDATAAAMGTNSKNLTSGADYLVLPRARAALLPDRRPIAAAEIVVLGPSHSSTA